MFSVFLSKELSDFQDRELRNMSMGIARCYPMKNRYPDVMPCMRVLTQLKTFAFLCIARHAVFLYCTDDATRVILETGSDDYINASHIGVSTCIYYIPSKSMSYFAMYICFSFQIGPHSQLSKVHSNTSASRGHCH